MSKPFDVCIRGDGVVGRTLALLLAQQGLRVALHGQASQTTLATNPPDDVRAYALNHAAQETLLALRAWPEPIHVTPVRAIRVWGDEGGQLDFTAPAQPQQNALAWIVDVAGLEQALTQAIRFQPQIDCVQTPVPAPLTVVCEGQRSISRQELGVQWTVKPYHQCAIAARLRCTAAHEGVARQWFVGGDILALLPLGGDEGHEVALVWSVAQARAAGLQNLPPDAFCSALQVACGQALGAMQLCSERASWPLVQAMAQRWVGPGWALAGDAAHAVHPLAGQGLNLGLADAAALAQILAGREYWRDLGDEKLLRRYERSRKAEVLVMDSTMDGLQRLFSRRGAGWQAARNWGMNGFEHSGLIKQWVARQAMG
jgi:2-polyprenyl-6-methoxyphenol hydroxylase-like FAD-dependent oxidoreductase